MIVRVVEALGRLLLDRVESWGRFVFFLARALSWVFRPPWRLRLIMNQLEFVGVQSLSIIMVTGFFTGGVFALQAEYGFGLFGAQSLTGSTVTLALSRSIGPVFAALMVVARAGSAMAAEIGTMKVTEQIDALEAMAVDPVEYLVAPRLVAGTLMVPILSALFSAIGLVGTWLVCIKLLDINEGAFWERIYWYADPEDLLFGLAKASVFGLVLAAVGCYKGLNVRGGAAGVGQATTQAVVVSSVSILVLDYFLTDFLMSMGWLT